MSLTEQAIAAPEGVGMSLTEQAIETCRQRFRAVDREGILQLC